MRLEPLYRVRFTYPESWAVGLDGGWQQMFIIAEGRCEGSVTGRFRGVNFPRKERRSRSLPARLPGCHRGRRRGRDRGGVARVWTCLSAGTPPDRRVSVSPGRPRAYRRLNDAVCVCTGEVRAPGDPGQAGPDLVIDVAELIWEPIAD
jgi:hypothetical protein